MSALREEWEGSVDVGDFLATMASVPAPVCVVTTLVGARPHGTTVSAFSSLSVAPPMVLAALDRGSDLLAAMSQGQLFGVNVLASDQAAMALGFARKGEDKFASVAWEPDGGAPRLSGDGGWLLCRTAGLVPGGDHVIVLGTVLACRPVAGEPLTYHARGFGTHRPTG